LLCLLLLGEVVEICGREAIDREAIDRALARADVDGAQLAVPHVTDDGLGSDVELGGGLFEREVLPVHVRLRLALELGFQLLAGGICRSPTSAIHWRQPALLIPQFDAGAAVVGHRRIRLRQDRAFVDPLADGVWQVQPCFEKNAL
jgi:hypothetical protein